MQHVFKLTALIIILLNPLHEAFSQISGTLSIPGDYPTLTAALDQIGIEGLSGATVLELQQDYVSTFESFPIDIILIPGISAVNTLTIRPAADASNLVIESANSLATVSLSNVSYVILDGRPGGSGSARELTIRNTDPFAPALRFFDLSQNNIVRYCTFSGANQSLFGGVIDFSSTEHGGDNSFNTITHCIIRDDGSGVPYNGIYASTSFVPSGGNTLSYNEIFNFGYSGIFVDDRNSGQWSITSNSLYNNLPASPAGDRCVIRFDPGTDSNGNQIEGNFIGGHQAYAAGSAWIQQGNSFTGIYISAGSASGSDLHHNTIQNLSLSSGGLTSFTGIDFASGILTNDGNSIGSPAYPIEVSGLSSDVTGILINSPDEISITNDNIGNITVTGSLEGVSIHPINYLGNAAVTITGNNIHDFTTNTSGTVFFDGIHMEGGGSNASSLHENVIKNIALTSSNSIQFSGISIASGVIGNNGNIIGSNSQSNSILLSAPTCDVSGIRINSFDEVSITEDVIGNITAIGQSTEVNGILLQVNGDALISGNSIQKLSGSTVKGIGINCHGASAMVIVENNSLIGSGAATGIETEVSGVSFLDITISQNFISNWMNGIILEEGQAATVDAFIHGNNFDGNETGLDNQSGNLLDATCNWWGDPSGPSGEGPGTGDAVSSIVIFEPWATIADFVSVNAGTDQTIYLGYGAQSKTLTATTVSCESHSLLWSTGATSESITVSPAMTKTYYVTITDETGHSAVDAVTVFVHDIRCGTNKVLVCHNGNTLCLNVDAVAAHLNHGDQLGACIPGQAAPIDEDESINAEKLLVHNFPNPFNDFTTIKYKIPERSHVELRIINLLGKAIDLLINNEMEAGEYHMEYKANDLPPSMYVCILTTKSVDEGIERKWIQRLVKIK